MSSVPTVTEASPEASTGLMTVEEVATRLRISRSSVYRLIASGQLTALRVGAQLRVDRTDLERAFQPTTPMPRRRRRR